MTASDAGEEDVLAWPKAVVAFSTFEVATGTEPGNAPAYPRCLSQGTSAPIAIAASCTSESPMFCESPTKAVLHELAKSTENGPSLKVSCSSFLKVVPSISTLGGQSAGVVGGTPLVSNEYVVATLSLDRSEER